MFLDLRDNLKSSGSSLYECSISYSTLKGSFAPRIPTTTSAAALNTTKPNTTTKREKAPDAQLSPRSRCLVCGPKGPSYDDLGIEISYETCAGMVEDDTQTSRDVLLRHGGRARSLARQEAGNNGHEEGERVSNDLHSLGRQSGEGTKHTVS